LKIEKAIPRRCSEKKEACTDDKAIGIGLKRKKENS
jgi:hypothetical protein